jgi:signal transduction histidine kinase
LKKLLEKAYFAKGLMNFKEFLVKNRETAQLVYGVVLIVLIPLLIAFNTVFIIKKYNQSLNVALQRHALSFGRSVSALIENDLPWEDFVQIKIETLIKNNLDIQELAVLIPEGDDFKIIASSIAEDIGKIRASYYYKLAWLQPENNGLATDSLNLAGTSDGEELINHQYSERFWLVAMPMRDASGEKQALLTIRLSSKIVDDLTNYNRNVSIYLLIGTVIIVVLFLLVAVRLWDYAILYKKIKNVDQMKDEFISMASHELRTPVTGIKGYVSMVLDGSFGPINDKVKKSLSAVQGAAERLSILVEDLLNVSRIEQGRVKINAQPLDISPVIEDMVNELEVQADKKSLALVFKPHKQKLPLINIDKDRFKQVIINLIGNAIKYTEKGSVEIMTEEKYDGRVLEFRIKDTGIGMSALDRERLFEKFYRVQNDKTKGIAGTGLGLWITKQLVELMNGTIMVDSIENVGTQVTLQFPIAKEK